MLRLEHAYTDVVEEFKYDSLHEQYNMDFLQWRRHSDSKMVFRFSENNLENVYVSGDAAVKQNAASAERGALMRCGQAIGAALLVFFITDVAGESLLNAILRLFGVEIRMDFITIPITGSQWAVVAARCVIQILKYVIPMLLLIRISKLPRHIFAPVNFSGIPEFSAAVGAAMMISGIYTLLAQRDAVELAQAIYTYKDTAAVFAYGVFDTLIASALAELFLRGAILTLLRQFGDPFAVGVTALLAFLFPNSMPDRFGDLLLGLAAGYLLIRSGSLTKCITLHVVYTGLNYARLVAVYTTRTLQRWEYSLLLISLGTLAISFYVIMRRHKLHLNNRRIVLSERQKYGTIAQTVTMLPWLAVSVLLTVVQLFY